MLKKILLAAALAAAVPAHGADSYEVLQQQLKSRDSALLDMQNRIDTNERTIRGLRGDIDDLKARLAKAEAGLAALRGQAAAPAGAAPAETAPAAAPAAPAKEAAAAPAPAAGAAPAPAPAAPKADAASDEQREYDAAFAKVSANDFPGARTALSAFVAKYPDSKLVPNCYYWLGQMAFKQARYDEARQNFLKVTQFQDSPKRADSIYKLGQSSQAMKDNEKAKKFYRLVVQTYPNTTEAVMAQRAIDALK